MSGKGVLAAATLAALLAALAVGHKSWLSLVARYLIVNEEPKPSDAIIVLGGECGAESIRTEYAAGLYQQGLAKHLIVSGGPIGWETADADLMARHARFLGVPEESIILERRAHTTLENARYSLEIMRERGLKSAIVVTSPFHTRRAAISFARVVPKDIPFTVASAAPSGAEDWWADQLRARAVLYEYFSLLWSWLFAR